MRLLYQKHINDFESYLKDKKYQIIKGRGIAFIDEKGVYVKGSEVRYSLGTVEKILQSSPEHNQIIISVQKEKDSKVEKQLQQQLSLNQEQIISNKVKNDLDKIADILLKPEFADSYIPNALLEKKKRKKKKYLSI